MADAYQQNKDMTNLFETWMNVTKHFWKHTTAEASSDASQYAHFFAGAKRENEENNDKFKAYRTWETSINNFLMFLQYLMAPENKDVMMKSGATFVEVLLHSATDSIENITDFQSQILEIFGRCAEHATYNFDEIDHAAFNSFRDLYKSEIQKYLQMPKIGLPREYQEKITSFIDTSSIFSSHLIELLYLFSVPLEKTNRTMQAKIKEMVENGQVTDDIQGGYREWIKILEMHYMEMLKSPDYIHVLDDTIQSMAIYKKAKDNIVSVMLKDLQIPTNKEMDEVYKDLYTLKKEVKSLRKEIKELKMLAEDRLEVNMDNIIA